MSIHCLSVEIKATHVMGTDEQDFGSCTGAVQLCLQSPAALSLLTGLAWGHCCLLPLLASGKSITCSSGEDVLPMKNT